MGRLGTYLFARPSFLEGMSRIVDFGDTLKEYNYSPTGKEADEIALWADWTVVGNDVRTVLLDAIQSPAAQIRELHRGVEEISEEESAS